MLRMFQKFYRVCKHGWVVKGARTSGLLIMGLFSLRLTMGYLIVPPDKDQQLVYSAGQTLTFLENFAPVHFFGALWALCFLTCIIQAFRKQDTLAMLMFASLNFLWSLSYFYDFAEDTLGGDYTRAWFTGIQYLLLGLLPAVVVSKIPNPYALEVEGEKGNVFRGF